MNIIVKSDDRSTHEARVARSFGVGSDASSEQREAVEVIARRSEEAYSEGRRMERR